MEFINGMTRSEKDRKKLFLCKNNFKRRTIGLVHLQK